MSTVIFVSGHMDLTNEEFEEHYVPRIREAWFRGCRFVVGDAMGLDTLAQRFLIELGKGNEDRRFEVYHMLEAPRFHMGRRNQKGELVGGFKSDEERDEAMTMASDEDIAWVRPGGPNKRGRGTKNNLARRRKKATLVRIRERKTWPRFTVGQQEIWPHLHLEELPILVEVTTPPIKRYVGEIETTDDKEWYERCLKRSVRVPHDLDARMTKAWQEYSKCQRELELLIHEQELLGD